MVGFTQWRFGKKEHFWGVPLSSFHTKEVKGDHMKYLTIKNIQTQIEAVKNRFNERSMDEQTIFARALFIYYDERKKKKRSKKDKEMFLQMYLDDMSRELVKQYEHVAVSKSKYGKYFIHITSGNKVWFTPMEIFVSENLGTTIEDVFATAEAFNKIHMNNYVETQVEFPTGEILFANFFKNKACDDYAFEIPDDLKYGSIYSINHSFGEQNTMAKLSETHGLGYVQLGNTSANIYKVGDDRIIMTPSFAYYMDEDDYEHDIPIPDDWELIGDICCDVWRVEFIDQQNFDKGDALPIDHKEYDFNKPVKGKVNPGTWNVKCRYHFMNDRDSTDVGEIPIWVDITRITS